MLIGMIRILHIYKGSAKIYRHDMNTSKAAEQKICKTPVYTFVVLEKTKIPFFLTNKSFNTVSEVRKIEYSWNFLLEKVNIFKTSKCGCTIYKSFENVLEIKMRSSNAMLRMELHFYNQIFELRTNWLRTNCLTAN